VLDRPRLVRALTENASRPLSLIIADAGYGKTTLLTSFAKKLARPVVWYSLMPSDADPIVFCRYLLEGFRRESPRFGRSFQRAIEESGPSAAAPEVLGGTLANEWSTLRGPSHLLVLDDFQEVAGHAQVVTMVDTLLRHLPESVRLLIASRSMPPLALDRLRARGEVFELDSSHLRLTRDEMDHLFREVYRRALNEVQLDALEQATLGWPTAVHLVHESLERDADATIEDVLARFRASNLELHDYLSSEVYTRLDGESRRLLERTAALSRFDADLAAALSDVRSAPALLASLARRGLLRTFGSGPAASFECHDLVRRFVRQEVESREGPAGWPRLEADTAAALAERGQPERALRHYLNAGRVEDAAQWIRALAPALLKQGRAAALLQYLSDLPPASVREDLALSLALADAQRTMGAWDEAERLYTESLEMARAGGEREAECRALYGLGRLLNLRGRHEQALGLAERALGGGAELAIELKARLLQVKAAAHFYLGQYGVAVRMLGEVRDLLKGSADPELLVPTVHNLAMAYAAQGKFREASQELRAALAQVRGTSSPRAPLYLSNLATLQVELGELAEARRAAEEGLNAARHFSNRAQEVTCHEALAQILAQSGDLDAALAALRRAEELNAELRMQLIAADLLALRGRIFCARGEYRRAVQFLNEAIEHLASARPDDPRLIEFRATLAWCELRSGRVRAAREVLQSLVKRADADENDYRRMRVHYWLAEAALALEDRRGADTHLQRALRLVRERGYAHFLKLQAREEPAPLLHALARGLEAPAVAAALVEAGPSVEEPLLAMLEKAPPAVAEAAISVLGEVAGPTANEPLAKIARERRVLRPAIKTALRHIADRSARGVADGADDESRPARLTLFGPPQLHRDGQPVPASAWRAQRAFHVLVFLALHPRGVGKDELLEHFWPGRQAAAGRRNFHPTLSYVRSVLPAADEAPILREGDFYRLNPAYPLACDAWELDRALDEARAAREPNRRRDALRRAALLVTGPFLQGLYADWADELQNRMRDRAEKLLLELGSLSMEAGDFDQALESFRRAVELDEYREATRIAVIECLLKLGHRRAALAEYDKLRDLLRDELGVEPLRETEEIMQRLLGDAQGTGNGSPTSESDVDVVPQLVAASSQVLLKASGRESLR
jgi:ATP/maltotriose-dependent transcriptional regulator MalT/DNA-binding SARP family transcriptional activator